MAMAMVDGGISDFDNIIALKLRKPRNWNWQLSTSKSSPHILLPVIKLYDYKGNLLLETSRDSGRSCQRRSWHSGSLQGQNWSSSDSKNETFHSELNCSDKRNAFDSNKRDESINLSKKNRQLRNCPEKTSTLTNEMNEIVSVAERKIDDRETSLHRCDSLRNKVKINQQCIRSDDAFQRRMRMEDSDRVNNIKRDDTEVDERGHKKPDELNSISDADISNKSRTPKIMPERLHPRYKTRTCSAGTLIIYEESFNNPNRRRRSNRLNNSEMDGEKIVHDENILSVQRENSTKTLFPPIINDVGIYSRKSNNTPQANFKSSPIPNKECSLRIKKSVSAQHPFNVRNPNTSNSETRAIRSSSEKILHKQHRKKKRRKTERKQFSSVTSTSSSDADVTDNDSRKDIKSTRIKACIKQKQQLHTSGSSSSFLEPRKDFFEFIRHLSHQPEQNVTKMGANVSRHSSKGLSGRRSQSSGSICNGKGRQNEGKSSGSLPSYLDNGDAGGCNNNQDCEKANLDDVPRIPPLGDGAPLHWKFSDTQTALCDQGYGSERSPEEEYPPPLPEHDNQCHHHEYQHLEPHACYPFITPESTFLVKLNKGSRGLGLSVTGGIDSGGSWPGLIRIKRLFPHQPASHCGLINVGDLLLEANGIKLTGLTNYEALEVLRTAPNQVELKICRPPPDVLTCVSPISEVPPPPPRREALDLNTPPLGFNSPEDDYYHGEFEIIINKIQGSLGFTLRKEDDSALGHYVRALVREPALTDGRIKAGDKIVAVNDVEISSMSHEQAVQFLRHCDEEVKLRLYRDASQTPVAALSPTETTPRTSFSRKSNLRQEAVDMLNDIAVRKLMPGNQDTYRRSLSPSASPRRLRRQPHPSDASQDTNNHCSNNYPENKDNDQFHEGMLHYAHPFNGDTSLFIVDSSDECDKPSRPSSLDLYNPNQTPVVARKPRFNFSLAHNAYELNNLDAEVLDAPNLTYNLGNDEGKCPDQGRPNESFGQGPASMPQIPLENSSNSGFSYKNPAYQTAHPSCVVDHEEHFPPAPSQSALPKTSREEESNIKKWKGAKLESNETIKSKPFANLREENEILAIELNRGWNSRLGFSLQGAAGVTYVSAVYANSVAAKDGRLKPGDRVMKVNDESVEHLSTSEIIDLLRIVRGPVCIVISRTNTKEDCFKSNAVN